MRGLEDAEGVEIGGEEWGCPCWTSASLYMYLWKLSKNLLNTVCT